MPEISIARAKERKKRERRITSHLGLKKGREGVCACERREEKRKGSLVAHAPSKQASKQEQSALNRDFQLTPPPPFPQGTYRPKMESVQLPLTGSSLISPTVVVVVVLLRGEGVGRYSLSASSQGRREDRPSPHFP